jgi:hypothetical protein
VITTPIDLRPFGFTSIENLVYGRLLTGGPASGYAVARDLLVARANVYQALRSLVAKRAAVSTGGTPQRFRAVKPTDLYAGIVERENGKLDSLEAQLQSVPEEGAESFVRIAGERGFLDLANRTAARERGSALILAPARLLVAMLPVLRKRLADALSTEVWLLGEGTELPIPITGGIPLARIEALFGSPVMVLLTGGAALLARIEAGSLTGYWTSDRAVLGATRAAVAASTIPPGSR